MVGNCTHDYFHSIYYRDTPEPLYWNGYDAEEQDHRRNRLYSVPRQEDAFRPRPLLGPPHNPYRKVPQRYLDMVPEGRMEVRPNCPHPSRENLRGYYAHVSSLDDQLGRLWKALDENGLMENTIFCFTSDHGDMLGSQNVQTKQHPWDESILVPFVLTAPDQSEPGMRIIKPFNVVDILPTLLGLAEVAVPATVVSIGPFPRNQGRAL